MFDRKRTSIYEVTPKVTKGSGVNAPKFENIFQRKHIKWNMKQLLAMEV